MNILLRRLKNQRAHRHDGLTLVELLIAMCVSTVVVMTAANLVIQSMQSEPKQKSFAASGLNGTLLAALWKQRSPRQQESSQMFLL